MTQDVNQPKRTAASEAMPAPVEGASSSLSPQGQGRRRFIRTGIVVGVPLILTLSSRSAWAGKKNTNTPPSNATALASQR